MLKCTHDSEGLVIVKDKEKLDKNAVKEKLERCLKQNFYYIGREWPYKNVKPRIIAEQYMEDSETCELRDYKFFCFNGIPKAMFIASDRGADNVKFDYFDMDFIHLDIKQKYSHSTERLKMPDTFEQMKELSEILSKGLPHVRVDFYEVDGQCYFGELTFYHFSGFMPFQPFEWDNIFGGYIDLSKI